MVDPSEWRAKAADYVVKAHQIADADLCRQYAELAARYFDIAKKIDDVGITAIAAAGGLGEV
jgi:hypothetical protein